MVEEARRRTRHDHQREVERLLEQIRGDVDELRRLHAFGLRGPALSERKRELAQIRGRLAAVVGGRHAQDLAA
jgi:hypothetical protein